MPPTTNTSATGPAAKASSPGRLRLILGFGMAAAVAVCFFYLGLFAARAQSQRMKEELRDEFSGQVTRLERRVDMIQGVRRAQPSRAEAVFDLIGRFVARNPGGEGAMEIAAYDPANRRLWVTCATRPMLRVIDLTDPTAPRLREQVDLSKWGGGVNSVAVHGQTVAAAVEGFDKTDRGCVVLLDTEGAFLNALPVGCLPDMLTYTPDGTRLVVACEGEADDSYMIDPEGTIAVIDLTAQPVDLSARDVTLLDFRSCNRDLPDGVLVTSPHSTAAQDIEPEYVAISPDSTTAWVTLQENNALAIVDLTVPAIRKVVGLGMKDHSQPGAGLDASDRDGGIHIATQPVWGMYQPDGIACFQAAGKLWLITANEGDPRDKTGWSDETRVQKLDLDTDAFQGPHDVTSRDQAGRLQVSRVVGDDDGDGRHERLCAFGARSLAVWTPEGTLVADTGDAMEQVIAGRWANFFNCDSDANDSFDGRSDNRGPEPESVVVGHFQGRCVAFVCIERFSAVMAWDVTDPESPTLLEVATTRNFQAHTVDAMGDLAPEGLLLIRAEDSPIGQPLLIVIYEVSGTLGIFRVGLPARVP